jgi:hypothetical protein
MSRFRSPSPARPAARVATLCAAVLALASASVADASGWRWSVTPYGWATDVGVDVTLDERTLVEEEIPVQDLLEDVETLVQVRIEAQHGAHGAFLDLFDVTLADDAATIALLSGGEATLKPEMGMTLLDAGALYDPAGDGRGWQVLYGARVVNERAEIDAVRGAASRRFEIDDTFVDALLGLRFLAPLGRRFEAQLQADASTGGTELTWSGGATIAYRFGAAGRYAALAGYRRMVVDFDTAGAVDARMTLAGAQLGLRVAF